MIHRHPVDSAFQNQSAADTRAGRSTFSTFVEYGKTIIITLGAALLLKFFVIDAYRIPSTSMENTLQIGDFILVNKLTFGLQAPSSISLTAGIPSFTLPIFRDVHRGDVIVFKFPGNKDEVKPSESVNYIKRCIGLPGDTVEIRFGRVYINSSEIPFPPQGIQTNRPNGFFGPHMREMLPHGSTFNDFNHGPVRVPKRDDILKINSAYITQLRTFIEREGHTIQIHADTILIDGITSSEYCVQRDYYFVLGDNRDNSMDSRHWGFVPDDHLIGEPLFVYWSWNPQVPVSTIFDKISTIRWERIGTLIK